MWSTCLFHPQGNWKMHIPPVHTSPRRGPRFILKGIERTLSRRSRLILDSSTTFHPQGNWKFITNKSLLHLSQVTFHPQGNWKLLIRLCLLMSIPVSSSKELKDEICRKKRWLAIRKFHPQRNWKLSAGNWYDFEYVTGFHPQRNWKLYTCSASWSRASKFHPQRNWKKAGILKIPAQNKIQVSSSKELKGSTNIYSIT